MDEALDLVDPAAARHASGRKKQEPIAARRPGGRAKPRTKRLSRRHKAAAGHIGDLLGLVHRAAVSHNDFAHDTSHRTGNQRGQRWHQHYLRIVRADHYADHAAPLPGIHSGSTISWGRSDLALRHAATIKRVVIVLVLFLVFS